MGCGASAPRPDRTTEWGRRALACKELEQDPSKRMDISQRSTHFSRVFNNAVECEACFPEDFAGGAIKVLHTTEAVKSLIKIASIRSEGKAVLDFLSQISDGTLEVRISKGDSVCYRFTDLQPFWGQIETASGSSTSGDRDTSTLKDQDEEKEDPEARDPKQASPARLLKAALGDIHSSTMESELDKLQMTGLGNGTSGNEELVTFHQLSAFYYKGLDVVFVDPGGLACGRVAHCEKSSDRMQNPIWVVQVEVYMSDGESFYKTHKCVVIQMFLGRIPSKALPAKPLDSEMREVLRARGEKYRSLAIGSYYRNHTGHLMLRTRCGVRKLKADGRIMVDGKAFAEFCPDYQEFDNPDEYQTMKRKMMRRNRASSGDTDLLSKILRDDVLHLTWPTLPCFSFARKCWAEVQVDNVEVIEFRDAAFDQLVINSGRKRTLQALVEYTVGRGEVEASMDVGITQLNGAPADQPTLQVAEEKKQPLFSDVVEGKGGGCIMLLHGPPGVGKTLTAEAIAEHLHRPLYSICVGELGTSPGSIEESLRKVFELGERWNAVILLDEADIFLEARSNNDVMRNAMVSVFLRRLEYHQGVLFLTTNRIKSLDPAFHSRIAVSLNYTDLDDKARLQVWTNLLKAAVDHSAAATIEPAKASKAAFEELIIEELPENDKNGSKVHFAGKSADMDHPQAQAAPAPKAVKFSHSISEAQLRTLAEKPMNGRQIKSTLRLSLALAAMEGSPLTFDHICTTLDISDEQPVE